jgi:Fe-Mn family superoxide dismutase
MNPVRTLTSDLGYELDALEPVLSRETVLYHLIQHHRDCYERTAALVRGTELAALPLESVVRFAGQHPGYRHLFAVASEAWSHDLYWHSLRPGGGGRPWGLIGQGIRQCFGTFSLFEDRMKAQASSLMGSGWLWVTWREGRIELITTGASESPLTAGYVPLLAVDLWEHAYYLDYYSGRPSYVAACLHDLIDWDFANARLLDLAKQRHAERSSLSWLSYGRPLTRFDPARAPTARS